MHDCTLKFDPSGLVLLIKVRGLLVLKDKHEIDSIPAYGPDTDNICLLFGTLVKGEFSKRILKGTLS